LLSTAFGFIEFEDNEDAYDAIRDVDGMVSVYSFEKEFKQLTFRRMLTVFVLLWKRPRVLLTKETIPTVLTVAKRVTGLVTARGKYPIYILYIATCSKAVKREKGEKRVIKKKKREKVSHLPQYGLSALFQVL
jgi:hypothetical protein